MGTNGDGNAYVAIRISDKIIIETTNNAFSDSGYDTLIAQESSLYGVIENLKVGSKIRFSATVLTGAIDITEEGKMTEPNYIAKFNKIEPIQ